MHFFHHFRFHQGRHRGHDHAFDRGFAERPFDHVFGDDDDRFEGHAFYGHHHRHAGHDGQGHHDHGTHGGRHHRGHDDRHDRFREAIASGRGGGRFGGGRFGGPFGFDDRDGMRGGRGGGRFGGRMFGTGDLRLLLLALIEEQPRHGYELIRTIEEMFEGQYSPSPGAIYPTLTMLEELGYARVEAETGGKKLYAITEAGGVFLDEHRDTLAALTERLQVMSRHMRRMTVPDAVREAMHTLKHQLINHHRSWDDAEIRRVAALVGATARAIAERDA